MRLSISAMLVVFVPASTSASDNSLLVSGPKFPPYIIKSDTGEVSGMMVDLIVEAADLADISVTFNISNWARALKEVQTGRADAIIPTMFSKDREEYLYYPKQELFTLEMMFFAHHGANINFNGDYTSLQDYTVGKLRNARVSPEFDDAVESGILKVKERSSVTTLMRAVARKRLDLVAIDYPTGMWVLRNENQSNEVKTLGYSLGKVATYLAFSKKRVSVDFANRINAAIKQVVLSGRRQEILHSYIYKN